jgi:hypothetical protein
VTETAGYQQLQDQQRQLVILEEKVQNAQMLTSREKLQRADWTEDFRSVDLALPMFYELVSDPEVGPEIQIEAQFAMGRILLEKEDPHAITYLQNVAQSHSELRVPALAILRHHHQKQGDKEQAKALESELYQAVEQYHAQAEADSTISPNDTLVPHSLVQSVVQPILYSDNHVYAFQQKIIAALGTRTSEMPGEIVTFVVVNDTRWLQKKVEKMEGTEIYRP